MKILVIGGTGLISAPFVAQFAERGDKVTVCNRAKRQKELPTGVGQVVADRTDYSAFENKMRELERFDVVIDMVNYQPEDALSLSRAFAGRVGQMIVCSTVDVYAHPAATLPITEKEPYGPTSWDYSTKKAIIEKTLLQAQERGDFPLTILRPAHTYDDGGALLHSLGGSTTYLDRLRKGKPIITHGDGTSLWVSSHAADVAKAFAAAAGNEIAFNKSYHLPGEEWLTWNRIHEIVAEALGAPEPTLVHLPTDLLARALPKRSYISRINFQYHNIYDTTAAKRDLGFEYGIPFAQGAKRVVSTLDAGNRIENSDNDLAYDRLIAAWERLSSELASEISPLEA